MRAWQGGPLVVLHTEARAAEKLAAFTRASDPWLVAVNMVSEGVDIPRLRVGVYATAAKTPLVFRQIVGRFVRTIPGRPLNRSWLYLPADPVLGAHAADVESELRHVLAAPGDPGDPEAVDDPGERVRSEPGEVESFVPVAADVAPQMALFGGGPPAPAFAASVSVPGAADEPEADPPAFERRGLLRDKRHRLVSDLRRRDGRSHAEINLWLNRASGIRRVEDATIAQLERSVELLLAALTARRR